MKKLILAASIAALSLSANAKDITVETNPLGLIFGIYNATVLYDVSETLSVGPQVSLFGIELDGDSVSLTDLGLRAEYMPKGNDNSGTYFAGLGDFATVSVESGSCTASATAFGGTATGGYKWVNDGGFVAKVGAGFGFGTVSDFDSNCSDVDSASIPFGGFALEWALGYKF